MHQAIRHGIRGLRNTAAFTSGAIVTIALSVGATTAIFSVVHAVLLRQLPYNRVERVFWIWSDQPGRDRTPFNVPDFIDYRDRTWTLNGMAGFFGYGASLSDEAAGERVQGIRATGISSTCSAREPALAVCCVPLTSILERSWSSCSRNRSGRDGLAGTPA
jgi:hypothetical protein